MAEVDVMKTTNVNTSNPQQVKAEAAAAEKAAADVKTEVEKAHAARAKVNVESAAKANASKPTPTPIEIDMARLGQHVMNKEDDGSGPDYSVMTPAEKEEAKKKAASAGDQPSGYRTREIQSDTSTKK